MKTRENRYPHLAAARLNLLASKVGVRTVTRVVPPLAPVPALLGSEQEIEVSSPVLLRLIIDARVLSG